MKQITQMHADKRIPLQAVCHTFDFQSWFAEIEQKAKAHAGCLEIVDALGAVRLVEGFDSLQFDQQQTFDYQADKIRANHVTSVHHLDPGC
jgi:hypothetical protein